ncbi:hypothetical protein C2E23DRAFT_847440 [Lenzites betulinus]|nr:hypothetical protein C2E23DRAFT_847440 [Lenzites betulinus]
MHSGAPLARGRSIPSSHTSIQHCRDIRPCLPGFLRTDFTGIVGISSFDTAFTSAAFPRFKYIGGRGNREKTGMGYYAYRDILNNTPDTSRWPRFCEYAKRTRVLRHDGLNYKLLHEDTSDRSCSLNIYMMPSV